MDYHSGDLLARISGDIAALENFYVRGIYPPLVAILVSLAASMFLAGFDAALAVALLVFLLLAGLGTPVITGWLSKNPGRQMVECRAELQAALVDGLQGLDDLLAFGQERSQLSHIDHLDADLAAAQRQMAWIGGLQAALGAFFSNLGMLAVLVAAIPLVASGRLDGVFLAVVALAALASFEAVLPLPLAAQHLESSLRAADRLLEVVQARPEVVDPLHPLPLPAKYSLEVRDLCFQFPAASGPQQSPALTRPLALSDISFDLPAGKRIAVVGPSGAGKSTLVHLLLRFWEYHHGEIRLGGVDLRRFRPDELRQTIGVVSQNTYLFSASVRDNLRLARPRATQAEIERAAEQAQIHSRIQALPDGYDTWIGEQGLRLSSGERQRLAIARALLKDPLFLILDEATANLDALTERDVLQAIDALMEGRTTLMITHRLVGLDVMDEILLMNGGRIVARGSHAALLAGNSLYRRMWELQNQEPWLDSFSAAPKASTYDLNG